MSKVDYSIRRQMQDDIIKAYCQSCEGAWKYDDAYKKVSKMPAPRYYISAKQAYQIVAKMVKGDFSEVDHMLPNRRRMYYSLFQKVMELSEQRAFANKSLWYIMPYVVTSPAPEFFIDYQTVGRIRRMMKSGDVDDEGKMVLPYCQRPRYLRVKEERRKRKEALA